MQNHANQNGSAVEELAEKLITANRWKRAGPGTNPTETGTHAIIIHGVWDEPRRFVAIGRYHFARDQWTYNSGDGNAVLDTSTAITHWFPLPRVPSNLEGV